MGNPKLFLKQLKTINMTTFDITILSITLIAGITQFVVASIYIIKKYAPREICRWLMILNVLGSTAMLITYVCCISLLQDMYRKPQEKPKYEQISYPLYKQIN